MRQSNGVPAPTAGIDPRHFRDTLAKYASGVTVITSLHEEKPVGFTCQSFYSVSLEPPLVSFSVMTTSSSYPKVGDAGRFVVNVLAEDQRALSDQFARSGTDKWAGVRWSPSPGGLPAIDGVIAWVECEIWAEHLAGDHFIVIGEVRSLGPEELSRRDPLLFYGKGYRRLGAK